jgi:DNA-binding LacI/PurR family transcriptional regulator
MKRIGKATMADVARRAGVSPSTVARALYSNGYVIEEKRRMVREAVLATGYRPNVVARGLRTSRSFTVGLVLSNATINPFFSHIAHAVQIEAVQHGYSVLSFAHNSNSVAEREGTLRLLDQHVDGMIFCNAFDAENIRLLDEANVPVVQIERAVIPVGRFALVDCSVGLNEAVVHLKSLGHRLIGYIGGRPGLHGVPATRSVEADRLAKLRAALRSADLRVDEHMFCLGDYYGEAVDSPLQGYVHAVKLLAMPIAPTAIITGSDLLAAGALQAVAEKGLRVPDDISIVGYDDSIATLLAPPLTTIAQPIVDLGRAALRLLLGAIKAPDATPRSECFPTRLVVRKSTGIARR